MLAQTPNQREEYAKGLPCAFMKIEKGALIWKRDPGPFLRML